ncbi:MAG: M28 family peptidase [Proteobacteria bacterium]|nr:M28 family peptidase [Pseudomonadota bacterium]
MKHIPKILFCVLVLAFTATLAAHAANPSDQACEARANDTTEKLLQCIHSQSLWQHLAFFQKISDANPGPNGHGNRNTGTKGYTDSVNHVATLMKQAGYQVTVQPYPYHILEVTGTPQFSSDNRTYGLGTEWFVARLSGGGTLNAHIQPADSGCTAAEFRSFIPGNIALLQRSTCSYDTQVENAYDAGAVAVVLYNNAGTLPGVMEDSFAAAHARGDGGAFQARLTRAAAIPVIGASYEVGADLQSRYASGNKPVVNLDIRTKVKSGTDYNLIAESPYGDPDHTVIVEGHLDAIYGAGMLDNASGSTTIMEIALNLAKTPTRNRLRYIWFGGEEIGLLGSAYYTTHLSSSDLAMIAFDLDADVTATPNYDYLVADPANAWNAKRFPVNVVPESRIGNEFFMDFFRQQGIPAAAAWFGNNGTDSNSFSLVGVPNTGILTQQDCCKSQKEVDFWGGVRGNYEGKIPGFNGGCVDNPRRWCDNLDNNDPDVFELASKATAYVTFKLANHAF